MGFLNRFKNSNTQQGNRQPAITQPSPVESCVAALVRLGYFQHAAAEDRALLVETVKKSLLSGRLSTAFNEHPPFHSKCHRIFTIPHSNFLAPAGFNTCLVQFDFLFTRIGLSLFLHNYTEQWEHAQLVSQQLTINDKLYTVLNEESSMKKEIMVGRLAEIINDQLMRQGKQERFYLSNTGLDTALVLLTDQQLAVLSPLLGSAEQRLFNPADWYHALQGGTLSTTRFQQQNMA